MIIKVCGMRDADNIRQIDELGCVDWMGFIFYPPSSRNVEQVPEYLPKHCKRVGVFVNASIEDIALRAQEFQLDFVQLHGHESPGFCKSLHGMLHRLTLNKAVGIIKMIQIPLTGNDKYVLGSYPDFVDYFLFETKCQGYGGSGQQFDWDILQHYTGKTPFLITGGIGAEDAEKVKAFHHPQFVGIDLNSRFEVTPALKDVTRIKNFVQIIQSKNKS